jgi:hypothetical protein
VSAALAVRRLLLPSDYEYPDNTAPAALFVDPPLSSPSPPHTRTLSEYLHLSGVLNPFGDSHSKEMGTEIEGEEEEDERVGGEKGVGRRSQKGLDKEDVNSEEGGVRSLNNRRLANATEPPTLYNPTVCLIAGESVVFDVSNRQYPVYLKDSLLNTNPQFDYSAFRQLSALAATAVTVSSFAFTFTSAGRWTSAV